MKKLSFLLFIVLCCNVVKAQRTIDLQTTLVEPVNNVVIVEGENLIIKYVVRNLGPDTLRSNDTMRLYVMIDGQELIFLGLNGASYYLPITQKVLAPGDSLVSSSPPITPSNITGKYELCIRFMPSGFTDTVVDNNASNDKDCANISVVPTGITSINEHTTKVNVYPNPALISTNIDIHLLQQQTVTIRLTDITGRVVMSDNKGLLPNSKYQFNINTAAYTPGLYLYQVITDNEILTGRLQVR